MQRQFTESVGERFEKGEVRDYPKATWDQIARSAKKPLDKFTKAFVPGAQPTSASARARAKKGLSDGATSARA